MIGLTVRNLMAMWENADPDALVEVSVAGMNGLVVRSASVSPDEGTTVVHLTVGPISWRDVQQWDEGRVR